MFHDMQETDDKDNGNNLSTEYIQTLTLPLRNEGTSKTRLPHYVLCSVDKAALVIYVCSEDSVAGKGKNSFRPLKINSRKK
eukprot:2892363-Ditylum_brightwellii.AAC.1